MLQTVWHVKVAITFILVLKRSAQIHVQQVRWITVLLRNVNVELLAWHAKVISHTVLAVSLHCCSTKIHVFLCVQPKRINLMISAFHALMKTVLNVQQFNVSNVPPDIYYIMVYVSHNVLLAHIKTQMLMLAIYVQLDANSAWLKVYAVLAMQDIWFRGLHVWLPVIKTLWISMPQFVWANAQPITPMLAEAVKL